MVKLFTNCDGVRWRYCIVNPFFSIGKLVDVVSRPEVREIWLDTGVVKLFEKQCLDDYPSWYLPRYLGIIKKLAGWSRKYGFKVYATIPDIPADYACMEEAYPFNVERTIHYIELFLDKYVDEYPEVTFVPVVQGKKDDKHSIIRTYMDHRDLYDKFEIIALGPTCSTRKWKVLADVILSFDSTVSKPYHVFGPSIRTVKEVVGKTKRFYSFDTTSYYFFGGKMHCRRDRQRVFDEFVKSLGIELD